MPVLGSSDNESLAWDPTAKGGIKALRVFVLGHVLHWACLGLSLLFAVAARSMLSN